MTDLKAQQRHPEPTRFEASTEIKHGYRLPRRVGLLARKSMVARMLIAQRTLFRPTALRPLANTCSIIYDEGRSLRTENKRLGGEVRP
jgi:hypothetical protein